MATINNFPVGPPDVHGPYRGLPNEILEQIVGDTDAAGLAALCRASKHLLALFQPRLYDSVTITNAHGRRCRSLLRTMLRKPSLALSINGISITAKDQDDFPKIHTKKDVFLRKGDILRNKTLLRQKFGRETVDSRAEILYDPAQDVDCVGLVIKLAANRSYLSLKNCDDLLGWLTYVDSELSSWCNDYWLDTVKSFKVEPETLEVVPSLFSKCTSLEQLSIKGANWDLDEHEFQNFWHRIQEHKDTLRSLHLSSTSSEMIDIDDPPLSIAQVPHLEDLQVDCWALEMPHDRLRAIGLPALKRLELYGCTFDLLAADFHYGDGDLEWAASGGPGILKMIIKTKLGLTPQLKELKVYLHHDALREAEDGMVAEGLAEWHTLKRAFKRYDVECELIGYGCWLGKHYWRSLSNWKEQHLRGNLRAWERRWEEADSEGKDSEDEDSEESEASKGSEGEQDSEVSEVITDMMSQL